MSVPNLTTAEAETAFKIAAELLDAEATQLPIGSSRPTSESVAPGPAARDAQKTTTKRLSTASELAEALGISRRWVYEHAQDLGAIRMGTGSKPRLRFDPDESLRRLQALSAAAPSEIVSSQARPRRAATGRPKLSDLLAQRGGGHRGA